MYRTFSCNSVISVDAVCSANCASTLASCTCPIHIISTLEYKQIKTRTFSLSSSTSFEAVPFEGTGLLKAVLTVLVPIGLEEGGGMVLAAAVVVETTFGLTVAARCSLSCIDSTRFERAVFGLLCLRFGTSLSLFGLVHIPSNLAQAY